MALLKGAFSGSFGGAFFIAKIEWLIFFTGLTLYGSALFLGGPA